MSDRDDLADLVGSARNVIKGTSLYFNGRIRYGTKGEKVDERLLCMDAVKVYICSIKIPVKIEAQFNILSIKLIERVSDSHVLIETDEKQTHALYGLHDKSSMQPFLIVLIRNLHAVFPHRLQAIVEIRPENEYDKLVRLSNELYQDTNDGRPCGGYSLRYECACDFHEIPFHRSVQVLVDTVFAHRISREFTFREFESIPQREWLPIIGALRYTEWFRKLSIENIKLTSENIDEICTVIRLCKSIRDLRLINCSLKHDFCTRFSHSLSSSYIENLDLSNNTLEDKGLTALCSSLQQRRRPLISINLQSCSITQKSLYAFNTALITNNNIFKNLQSLNLSGNRIKEENCITILFNNSENVLEELHLSDVEFSVESFFHSLASVTCKLRRLFITSVKTSVLPSMLDGVKLFFVKNQTLEILQISNANLSNDFLRELCDGLHGNVYLNKLDLRLSGNELEEFIHEYAARFTSIPCLTALDVTGCDLDNEIPNFLGELKKNRKLKTLHLGKNFNNIKHKNMQRTISAMKDLVFDSNLEYFSIADSKLKENTSDFLQILTQNSPLKILDIRGNFMGDTGVRVMTHILQMNRNLHTIFLDRNLPCLNSFEEIINAMEENYTVQYFPIPITDIVQMKITERDRMEKVQILINKLDAICTRNQQQKDNLTSNDSLVVTTTANLTRERNLSWENHQQLIGDAASLDYVSSYSNRLNNHNNDLNPIFTRTANITKISTELYDLYIDEEERLKNEWNEMCRNFQQKVSNQNERLARKFYQLFKEQSTIHYDDKFQEQIQTFFTHSNENIDQLLTEEIPNRLITYSRQCYIDVATSLQKRAYDTTNDMATDMHKQMETALFHTKIPQQGSMITDSQHQTSSSTLERGVSRNNNIVYRSTHKHNQPQTDINEEVSINRQGKQLDLNEYVPNPSPNPIRSTSRVAVDKDSRLLPTSSSPKTLTTDLPKSILNNTNERESSSNVTDPIYSNIQVVQRPKKKVIPIEDEGDLIEHDLLNLVEEEQQRDTPPALPMKNRSATIAGITATHDFNTNALDVIIESSTKLVHPGKDRPRRANVRRPIKRSGNGALNDSSSDGGLLTDENDDTSQGDILPKSTSEIQTNPPSTSIDSQINELPVPTVAMLIKSALKPSKTPTDESPPTFNKPQLPAVQPRPSSFRTMTRSMTISNPDPSQLMNSTLSNESITRKPSMSSSVYSSLAPSNNNNNTEHRDANNSVESVTLSAPPVSARTGKAAIGARVLPILDPNGEAPPVKLRHILSEKKVSLGGKSSSIENSTISDASSSGTPDSPAPSSSKSNTIGSNEQYKPLTVKERARMLATTIPPGTSIDKRSANTILSQTPPYTPRTYRRITEQVNLFC